MLNSVKGIGAGTTVTTVNHRDQCTPLYNQFGKRVLDILFVILTAPLSLMLVPIMAILIMRTGAKPFFFQERVGEGGKTFRIIKMQTMVPNAGELLATHLANNPRAQVEWEQDQKLKNDPRITPIGKLLRRTSLDELPQLWNVLRGEMSIVGPRPIMTNQLKLYSGKAYFELRPGITGPWQVSDRNMSSFAARAEYDSKYLENLSLKTDISILVRTVGAVLRCTGH
ncbi:MAG: sugar transferase [Pseudomonadota bacterium]